MTEIRETCMVLEMETIYPVLDLMGRLFSGLVDVFLKILPTVSPFMVCALTAWFGFHRWRVDLFAKRRIELCEEVLACLYECNHFVKCLRSPVFREPRVDSNTEQRPDANPLLASLIERINDGQPILQKCDQLKYRFMATYGKEWEGNFEASRTIAKMLPGIAERYHSTHSFNGGNHSPHMIERLRGMEIMLFGPSEDGEQDNEIFVKEFEGVEKLEKKCREEIEAASRQFFGNGKKSKKT